ncbi:PA14 domain-containing protein [Marinobacter flavimaris]|uniref:PA14 domain-containing protein n=1 Tax=Marinobacter flavimaris TaxID=262076 RepID=UPI0038701C57
MPLYVLLFIICSVVTLAGCQTWPPGDVEDLPPTAALPQSSVRGEVQVYYWDNISGVSVDSLTAMETYPEEPDTIETLGELRGLSERGDNYGSLVRGYIHPPASGFYTFYVSGDDETELWLSRSSNPDQITRIATVPGWTKELIYDKYASQQSPSIELGVCAAEATFWHNRSKFFSNRMTDGNHFPPVFAWPGTASSPEPERVAA